MLTERISKKIEHREKRDSLVLLGTLLCGMSAASDALAAPIHNATESMQPLTAEQLKDVVELKEMAPLARAVDAVPDAIIRAEGYRGDITARKERAKSQIPLLYNVRWLNFPGDTVIPFSLPLINVEIFTRGAFIYFDIPGDERLQELGMARSDVEQVASNIKKDTALLIDMPVQRVERREDANIVVHFNDRPVPQLYDNPISRSRSEGIAPDTFYKLSVTPFFPLGNIFAINKPDQRDAIEIPLTSEWREEIAKYESSIPMEEKTRATMLELGKFGELQRLYYMAIHEIAHYLGYGHSNEKGHVTSYSTDPQHVAPQKLSGKKPVIPEGASVYTDKEGDKYFFAPGWGDIRKSPIIDLNFFLRIFAKQNKERQLMEERNKQNKE